MIIHRVRETNIALCEALGLDASKVAGVTIVLTPCSPLRISVELLPPTEEQVEKVCKALSLTSKEGT